jgi:thioesterase domain-containing protein
MSLFARIEGEFGKTLPLVTLFQAPTIEQLAGILRQEGWSAPWSSLIAIRSGGCRPPFFCVHAMGGDVFCYHNLVRYLGADQPVYGLQARGLDGKLPPHNRIEDMAAHYIKEIRTLQPQGPYLLGGTCFGGVVALEVAQQLWAEGEKVALVALLDPIPASAKKSFRYYFHFCANYMYRPGAFLSYTLHTIIPTRLKRLENWFARVFSRSRARRPQPIDDYLYRAYKRYVPRLYPGRITCIMNGERGELHPYPWSELAGGGLDWHTVPGSSHSTMLREPYVQIVAEILIDSINYGNHNY